MMLTLSAAAAPSGEGAVDGEPGCAEEFSATLDVATSPIWERVNASIDAVSLDCNLAATTRASDVPFAAFTFVAPPTPKLLEVTMSGSIQDTVLALYCDPFDPELQTSNLVAFDDDSGAAQKSQFSASDGILLTPHSTYHLVVSVFDPEAPGTVDLCVTYADPPAGEGEGIAEGAGEGVVEGSPEGGGEGIAEGAGEGTTEGTVEGNTEGGGEGVSEGAGEGTTEGAVEGSPEGGGEGVTEGEGEGTTEGVQEGSPEGDGEGVTEGEGEGDGCAEEFDDTLDIATSPIWKRVNASVNAISLNCNLAATTRQFDVPFAAFTFVAPPTPKLLEVAVSGSISDTVLALYCDPFDPGQPTSNLVAFDDDSGAGQRSAFSASDGIRLKPNDTYHLVVSVFDPEAPGTVELCVTYADPPPGEGEGEGAGEGIAEGAAEGVNEGVVEGVSEGAVEGVGEGAIEGDGDGTGDGEGEGGDDLRILAQTLLAGFQTADTNNDERLSFEEAQTLIPGLTQEQFDALDIAITKETGDGFLTERELIAGSATPVHTADQSADFVIDLTELLRVIQFYNAGGYACAGSGQNTEDGYLPGPAGNQECLRHSADFAPFDFNVSLSELLRQIQFFNATGYHAAPNGLTEDGFDPGPTP
ncbi:MAG: hypothetical protein GC168_05265 [Candidatus Hydrogenedens sp.]|nr:hypothetical protein [Candidatus Hydrogenedens sp.]